MCCSIKPSITRTQPYQIRSLFATIVVYFYYCALQGSPTEQVTPATVRLDLRVGQWLPNATVACPVICGECVWLAFRDSLLINSANHANSISMGSSISWVIPLVPQSYRVTKSWIVLPQNYSETPMLE